MHNKILYNMHAWYIRMSVSSHIFGSKSGYIIFFVKFYAQTFLKHNIVLSSNVKWRGGEGVSFARDRKRGVS